MELGVASGLGSAITVAITAMFITTEARRIDTLSLGFLRAIWAGVFFAVMLVALSSVDDLLEMSFDQMWPLAVSGFLASGSGETIYAATFYLMGMVRALPIVMGLHILLAFVGSAIFLGETATVEAGAGAALVVGGVYLVAIHGHPRREAPSASAPSRRGRKRFRPWAKTDPVVEPSGLAIEAAAATSVSRPSPDVRGGGGELQLPIRTPSGTYPSPTSSRVAEATIVAPVAVPLLFLGSARLGSLSKTAVRSPLMRWILAHRVAVGLAVALLTGINFATASVMLRDASVDIDPAAATFVRTPGMLVVLGIAALAWPKSNLRRMDFSRRSMISVAIIGLIGTGGGAFFFIPAVQELGAGKAAALASSGPIFGLPLALFFLRERVTIWGVLGTAAAVAGIVVMS